MTNEKKTSAASAIDAVIDPMAAAVKRMQEDDPELDAAVEAAEAEAEEAVRTSEDCYTHVFDTPFSYCDETWESLTFDWSKLTGKDSLAIERKMITKGQQPINELYNGLYLTGIAARACTTKTSDGKRIGEDVIENLPLSDFREICKKARGFFTKSEFLRAMGANGSGIGR